MYSRRATRIGIQYLPEQVITNLACFIGFWINSPPATHAIGQALFLREIITGRGMDYTLHCRPNLSQYVHEHVDSDITNDTKGRNFIGLYLRLTGNLQGIVNIINLMAGYTENTQNFTEVSIPYNAIGMVNKWKRWYKKGKKECRKQIPGHVQTAICIGI